MVYQPPTKPSAKALGKRPENRSRKNPLGSPILDHEESTDNVVSTSCPSKDSVESRQKRVLPSRSRRGGPGIGSCDADVHIIDALRRKGENDPLIPPNTIFVLTTDTSMTPSTSAQDLQQNLFANERYFERPEVIKAFREQQDIEIPEYTVLGDEARVGGRLRARGEEDPTDLSDAAYERRHKKYESFERRQRLREKEKLKHEHYKLKERIEQLRNMDYTAFLGLPVDVFTEHELSETEEEYANSHSEGERRRRVMLDAAQAIEERYRVLLPAEKKTIEKGQGNRRLTASEEPRATSEAHENSVQAQLSSGAEEIVTSVMKPLTLRLRLTSRQPSLPTSVSSVSGSSPSTRVNKEQEPPGHEQFTTRHRRASTRIKNAEVAVINSPNGESRADIVNGVKDEVELHRSPTPPILSPPITQQEPTTDAEPDLSGIDQVEPSQNPLDLVPVISPTSTPAPTHPSSPPITSKRIRRNTPDHLVTHESISAQREFYSPYPDDSFEITLTAEDIDTFFGPPQPWNRRPLPAIIVEAKRSSDIPDARKTSRHTLAFGSRLPNGLAEVREFELPEWFWAQYVQDAEEPTHEGSHRVNGTGEHGRHGTHTDDDKMDEEHILQPPLALAAATHGLGHGLLIEPNVTAHPSPASLSDAQTLLGLSQVRLRQPNGSNGTI